MTKPTYTITPYPLRLDEPLKKAIKQAASDNSRSMHAEIVHRLQESFDQSSKLDDSHLKELLREVIQQELAKK